MSNRYVLRLVIVSLALFLWGQSAYALEIPPSGSAAFLQTSGPATNLGVGDYYTSNIGEPVAANRFHRMEIYVPCGWPGASPITFALYDPESSDPDPVAPAPPANDEVRPPANNTTYTLRAPGGGVIAGPRTFTPAGGTNGLWVELLTFTPGTPGFGCGTYELTNTTVMGNDDNAWRLRVTNDPDCTVTPGTCSTVGAASSAFMGNGNGANDIDGLAGTGDELVAGLTRTSYQHNGASCQDFYQFVDATSTTVAFNNFDLDVPTLVASITYFPPNGATIAGTASGVASWNGSPDNSAENPNPPRTGDVFTVTPDLVGWWRFRVCVGATDNQYIFEGLEGKPVFFQPVPFPNMTISKDDGRTTVSAAGEQVTYTIQYANTGNGAAVNATIIDTLPAGATFVSCTGSCTGSGAGPITWNLGTVPGTPNAGSTGSVTVTMQLPASPAGSTHTNSVSIDYTDVIGNNYPPSTGTDVDTVIGAPTTPNITTSKDDGLTTVSSSGQTVTYTIQYANTGNGVAVNAVITDTLPAGATFVSCTGSCTGSGAGPITWNLGTVSVPPAAGSSGSVTITMQLPASPAGSTHTNSVSITYTDIIGGNYPPATGTDVDTVVGSPTSPNMTISKDDALTTVSSIGQTVTYTIQYANTGTADAINATITDTLPAGATFVSCTGSCTGSGAGPITWNLGTVSVPPAAGSSGSVTITMQLPASPAGSTHTNTVSITYTDGVGGGYPPATGTDVDTVVGSPTSPNMTISKDDALTTVSSIGQTVTYTIQYANTGTADAINATITDTLPAGATFVSCTGGCTGSGAGPITWNLGTVSTPPAAGSSGSVTITMQLPASPAGSTHTNSVSITYTDGVGGGYPPATGTDVDTVAGPTNTPDPAVPGAGGTPTASATSALGTPVALVPSITPTFVFIDPFITKHVDPAFSLPGEIVTWTIAITNPGTLPISNVVVTDTLPSQVEILGTIPSSSAITFSGQTVTFKQATLTAGEIVTFQVQARVRGTINVARLTNRACIDFAQSTSDHCASATVRIVSQLPSTGESPWSPWRLPIFLMVIGGVVLGIYAVRRGLRSQAS